MKTKLTLIFALFAMMAFSQVRPPLITSDLRTTSINWNSLQMQRDSLAYWLPIDKKTFQLRSPNNYRNQTYHLFSDSIFISEINLWVCEGCTFTRNDSTFRIRHDPECSNCWQYSYDGNEWSDLFCEQYLDRVFKIIPSSTHILRAAFYDGWEYESNIKSGITYMGFIPIQSDSGKFLFQRGDSVVWQLLPIDSIFSEFEKKWKFSSDTIEKQRDSIYFIDGWYPVNGDTLRKVPFLDSVYFANTLLKNKDTISDMRDTITINNIRLTDKDSITINDHDTITINNIRLTDRDSIVIGEFDSIQINDVWYKNGSILHLGVFDSIKVNATWVKNGQTISFGVFDSLQINGIWVKNKASINVSTFDSIQVNGSWIKNKGSITIPITDEKVLLIDPNSGYPLYTGYLSSGDFSIENVYGSRYFKKIEKYDSIGKLLDVAHNMQPAEDHVLTYKSGVWTSHAQTATIDTTKWALDANGIHSKFTHIGVNANSVTQSSIYSSSSAGYGVWSISGSSTGVYGMSTSEYGVRGVSSNSIGVYGQSSDHSGVWGSSDSHFGVIGTAYSGYGVEAESNTGYGLRAISNTNYSAFFAGGLGVNVQNGLKTDTLQVGTGSIISRTGTMATYDFWTGTQDEWTANTPKNGIYPQATTTFWTIKD